MQGSFQARQPQKQQNAASGQVVAPDLLLNLLLSWSEDDRARSAAEIESEVDGLIVDHLKENSEGKEDGLPYDEFLQVHWRLLACLGNVVPNDAEACEAFRRSLSSPTAAGTQFDAVGWTDLWSGRLPT